MRSMTAAETQTDRAYESLRNDILSGVLAAGSTLQFAQLRETYGHSMGVLREALTRLAAEGLAVKRAQHGFRVIDLTLKDLNDLTESRILVETAVLRDAIEHGDLDWESAIISAHHKLERTEKHINGDPHSVTDAWAIAHQAFHMALLSSARNDRLKSYAEGLRASAELYRRWSMPFEIEPRDVDAEHRALRDLTVARDVDEACGVLAQHLSFTRDLIVRGQTGAGG
ncbi:MAG: GntR family transcriptional regulator [Pseudomonadota bacterium]